MKYRVVISIPGSTDPPLIDETVDTPAEVNKLMTSMLGVRISDWATLSIHIYKKEF